MILAENLFEATRPHTYRERQAGAIGVAEAAARYGRLAADRTAEEILTHRLRSYGQLPETGSPAAVLRRSEGTRFFVPERRRSRRLPGAIRAARFAPPICRRSRRNDSRRELILLHSRFVGFDEDGGSPANIAASEASNWTERAPASGAIKRGMMHTMNENEIRTLYEKLIAGWNAHDAEAMAAPFAEDGVIIGFDGSVSSGARAIAAEMAGIFADHETGRYAVKVKSVRGLGSQAVILRAIAGLVRPGHSAINSQTNSHQTVVAEEQNGQWRIVLFQNTPAQFHGRPELVEDMTRELQAV